MPGPVRTLTSSDRSEAKRGSGRPEPFLCWAAADLSPAYWRQPDLVQSWTRNFEFLGTTLRVTDACRVAPGVRPVFQLHVPTQPVLLANGSIAAGRRSPIFNLSPGGSALRWPILLQRGPMGS